MKSYALPYICLSLLIGCKASTKSHETGFFGFLNSKSAAINFVTPARPTYGASYFYTSDIGSNRLDQERFFENKADAAYRQNQGRLDKRDQIAGGGIYLANNAYDLFGQYGDWLMLAEVMQNTAGIQMDSNLTDRLKKADTLATIQLSVPLLKYPFSKSFTESPSNPGTPDESAAVVRAKEAINSTNTQYFDTARVTVDRATIPLMAEPNDIFEAIAAQCAADFKIFFVIVSNFSKENGYFRTIPTTDANVFAVLQLVPRYADIVSGLYGGDSSLSNAFTLGKFSGYGVPYRSDQAPFGDTLKALKNLGLLRSDEQPASMKAMASSALAKLRADYPDIVEALASHIRVVNYSMGVFSYGQGITAWGVEPAKFDDMKERAARGADDDRVSDGEASQTSDSSDASGEAAGGDQQSQQGQDDASRAGKR